jgi:Tol biopolymer transport system component
MRQFFPIGIMLLLMTFLAVGTSEGAGHLTRITYSSTPERRSDTPDVSSDGDFIAFHSSSDFHSEGIQDYNVWRLDTQSGELVRISDPLQPGRVSTSAVLSGDGQRIVFRGDGDFLGEGIKEKQYQIWLYDEDSGSLSRISDPVQEDRISASPVLSEDGRTIAFVSDCDFLSEGIEDGNFHVWLYDIPTGGLTRVTAPQGDRREGRNPSLSSDGSRLVFESDCDFLDEGVAHGQTEIWHYDVSAAQYTRITYSQDADRASSFPTISGDGARIVFRSDSDFHGEGIPAGQAEIWVYDMEDSSLRRITVSTDEERACYYPSISSDGGSAVFCSDADLLGEGIADNQFEVWIVSLADGLIRRVSHSTGEDRTSVRCATNAGGEIVVFASDSDMHEEGIADQQFELWLWQREP